MDLFITQEVITVVMFYTLHVDCRFESFADDTKEANGLIFPEARSPLHILKKKQSKLLILAIDIHIYIHIYVCQ